MKRRLRYGLLIVLVSCLAGVFAWRQILLPIDRLAYDFFAELRQAAPPTDMVIVAIDEKSLQAIGRWPWPRRYHARLLNTLQKAGVRAVVMDILLTDRSPDSRADDLLLAQAIESSANVALPIVIEQVHNQGQLVERLPLPEFSNASGILGHVHVERDDDGVSRAVFLKEGINTPYWPHVSVSLLSKLHTEPIVLPGVTRHEQHSENSGTMRIARDYFNLIEFLGPDGTVPHLSYADAVDNNFDAELLRDKIVFVGMTATGTGDSFVTPVGQMAGVELNANIFESLRRQQFIQPTASVYRIAFSVIGALLLVVLLSMLSPKWLFWSFIAGIAAVLFASYLLLIWARLWFPPASIVAALIVFYPLWNWQRLELALAYLQAELEKITATSPTLQDEPFSQRYSALDRYVESLRNLQKLYPALQWQITQLSNGSQIKSGVADSISNAGSQPIHRKTVPIDDNEFLFELGGRQAMEQGVINFIDRTLFAAGEVSRRYTHYGTEIVEKTLLELIRARRHSINSQELAKESIEYFPEAMLVTDAFGRVKYINKCAREVFPFAVEKSESVIDVLSGLHTDHSVDKDQLLRDLIVGGRHFVFEGSIDNGHTYMCHGQRIVLEEGGDMHKTRVTDNSLLVFIFSDITLLKANEQARLDTLHFLSHDIRSPMTSVLALIETAKMDGSDNNQQVLEKIESYVQLSLKYAQQFIQLAKAENIDKQSFYLCDMRDIVDNAVDQIFPAAKSKNIAIAVNAPEEPIFVMGDGDLLERMLGNILSNAVKFSKAQDQVQISLRITDEHLQDEQLKDQHLRDKQWARVEITDQGPGIPTRELPYIFDRFKTSRRDNPNGTGLGLYFVGVVCERHGGTVTAVNNPDRGTTFSVEIPLHDLQLEQP